MTTIRSISASGLPNSPSSTGSVGALIGTGDSDGPFAGASELATHLLASRHLTDCFVRQIFRFAMGQVETSANQALISALGDEFSIDRPVPALMLALVTRPEFVLRTTAQPSP